MVGAVFHPVDFGGLGPGNKVGGPLLHHRMAALGVAGHHNIFGAVLLVGFGGGFGPVRRLHNALGVGNTGTHFQQHRRVEPLGKVIGQFGKGQRFGGVGRLQHGDFGCLGIVAGILLVLGAVHARVVGHDDDHTGVDAGVGNGKQGVGGHIETHMLHAAKAAVTGQGRAEGRFHGHLFIGGPFGVNLRVLGGGLGNLRAGGAGVAGDEAASGLVEAAGNGFVAQHQRFHGYSSSFTVSRGFPMESLAVTTTFCS